MGCRIANGILIVLASHNLYMPVIIFVFFGYRFQVYFFALHGGLSLVLLKSAAEDPTGTCMRSCVGYCYSSCVQGLTDETLVTNQVEVANSHKVCHGLVFESADVMIAHAH